MISKVMIYFIESDNYNAVLEAIASVAKISIRTSLPSFTVLN